MPTIVSLNRDASSGCCAVVEESHALRLLEAGLAGLDGMDDLIEGTLKPTTA
jgi:hypothetical protein